MPPCKLCGKPLVPIGSARANGAKHGDWESRGYHKRCFKKRFGTRFQGSQNCFSHARRAALLLSPSSGRFSTSVSKSTYE